MADEKEQKIEVANRLVFDYEKADAFRVIHVDGIHGGLAPNSNQIIMSLFSERRPIPQKEAYDIVEGRLVRDSSATVTRECDVLREVEVCAIMNVPTARALWKWLGEKFEEHDKVLDILKAHRNTQAHPEVPRD